MARSRRKRDAFPERRTTFRLPVSGLRSAGLLEVGKQQFEAIVVDESAGGFSVEVNQSIDCQLDDVLMLRVGDDWYQVRVVFLDVRDIGVERFAGCNLTCTTRLGFKRLYEEHSTTRLGERVTRSAGFRRPFVQLRRNTMVAAAVSIFLGLAVVGVALTNFLSKSESLDPLARDSSADARVVDLRKSLDLAPDTGLLLERKTRRTENSFDADALESPELTFGNDVLKDTAERAVRVKPREKPLTMPSVPEVFTPPVPDKKQPKDDDAPRSPVNTDWHLAQFAQPDFLLRPDIAQQLGITDAQRIHLERIRAERRPSGPSPGSAPKIAEQELTRGRQCLAILTADQQQRLAALPREPEAPGLPNSVPSGQADGKSPSATLGVN